MKKRNLLLILVFALTMQLAFMTGCGSSDSNSSVTDESEFLLGSWFAETATYNGEERDPDEVFGGIFQLYFNDNGECTMSINSDRAVVNWEYTGDGVILTGDDTYDIRFPNDSKDRLIITINGIDVLMTKYEQ